MRDRIQTQCVTECAALLLFFHFLRFAAKQDTSRVERGRIGRGVRVRVRVKCRVGLSERGRGRRGLKRQRRRRQRIGCWDWTKDEIQRELREGSLFGELRAASRALGRVFEWLPIASVHYKELITLRR